MWICFSPLISHMFLITCEKLCQPVCEILLYLPLCLHTSTHTRLISFKETVLLRAMAPREVCVRACVCDSEREREREIRPLLWLHREWTLLITMKLRSQTFYCRLLPPHAHLISLPPPFLTRSPPFSFLPLSVREGIQCAFGASFNKVKCRASVRKISRHKHGSLEENSSIST